MARVVVLGSSVAAVAAVERLQGLGHEVAIVDDAEHLGGELAPVMVDGQAVEPVASGFVVAAGVVADALERWGQGQTVDGWPSRRAGEGVPAEPRAFAPGARRFGFVGGLGGVLERALDGVERFRAQVVSVSESDDAVHVGLSDGRVVVADAVISALSADRSVRLLGIEQPASRCRASVVVVYPSDVPAPSWDVCWPGDGGPVAAIHHDAGLRRMPKNEVYVLELEPHVTGLDPNAPDAALLDDALRAAARHLGAWALTPSSTRVVRWSVPRRGGASHTVVSPRIVSVLPNAEPANVEAAWSCGESAVWAWETRRHRIFAV